MPYPNEIDEITTGEPGLPLAFPDPLDHLYGAHNRIAAAVRAIETALGLDPPYTLAQLGQWYSSFSPRLATLEAALPGLSAQVATAEAHVAALQGRANSLEDRICALEQAAG